MKKVYLIGGLFVMALAFTLAMGINFSAASPEIGRTPIDLSAAVIPGADQTPVPMAECAKIECGTCPGAKCKIDGICCYVPNKPNAGVASCGCTADGEPVCKCDAGVPR